MDKIVVEELYDVLHECENGHVFYLTMDRYHWKNNPHMYMYGFISPEFCPICMTRNFHRLESPSYSNSYKCKKKQLKINKRILVEESRRSDLRKGCKKLCAIM